MTNIAKAVRKQYGSLLVPLDANIAKVRGKDEARNLNRIIKRNDLAEGIRISEIEAVGKRIPVLGIMDYVNHMVDRHQLFRLIGNRPTANNYGTAEDTLDEFWKHFLKVHPDYWLAEEFASGRMNPRRVIPVYTHIDEGRGTSAYIFALLSLYMYRLHAH